VEEVGDEVVDGGAGIVERLCQSIVVGMQEARVLVGVVDVEVLQQRVELCDRLHGEGGVLAGPLIKELLAGGRACHHEQQGEQACDGYVFHM